MTLTVPQATQRAIAAYERGAWGEAELLCRQVLAVAADAFDALNLLGIIAAQTRRTPEAAELLGRAVAADPANAVAHNNYGNTLKQLGRLGDALASYDRALQLNPGYAEACNNRGVTLQELNRLDEASESFAHALKVKPDYAEALINRGVTLQALNRLDEALDSYARALKIKPNSAEAYSNRGNVLLARKRLDEALDSFDRALKLKPELAEAHYNRGKALQELKRLDAALASYDRALQCRPDYVEAHCSRGYALQELKRLDAALDSYDRALKIKPDFEFMYGAWLHTKMLLCTWDDAERHVAELLARIENQEKASHPFPVSALTGSLSLQRKAAEIWVGDKHPASLALPPIVKHERREKLHIGYFSADFRNHAVAHVMAGLFETHDKSRFACTAFSYGPDTKDDMRKRVEAAFDSFIDVRNMADTDVAVLARKLEVDIAIDLGGFTEGSRTGIFAMRAAPLQVNYLGYPGTMGADYMDYLLADRTLIPETSRRHYAEKIAYLPDSYLVSDGKRAIAEQTPSREALGLPRTGFVFCGFNASYKITPGTFDGWMRILQEVAGSVLWLREDNATATRNLRQGAAARGVGADRLIFAPRMPLADHLARHRVADLFLDTLPYNAATTAIDALWAGLPVLTCMGESFASRLAASLLHTLDLPELVTTTPVQFEALAVELATQPQRLEQIRRKLERNRLTTPLFDTPRFTRHLEAAYAQMYARYQADLPPDHLHVSS